MSNKDLNTPVLFINEELQEVATWLKLHKQSMNLTKKSFIFFRTNRDKQAGKVMLMTVYSARASDRVRDHTIWSNPHNTAQLLKL